MGWFWADKVVSTRDNNNNNNNNVNIDDDDNNNISLCPVMRNSSSNSNNNSRGGNTKEQYSHDSNVPAGLNPLNYIPKDLSSTETQPGQKLSLTTTKTISSIPRGEQQGKWEYPSAQQMYNAMVKKGKIGSHETLQEDTVEAMVQIHNFLNESCWYEILRWEKPYTDQTHLEPKLLKFMGKPGVLTPRAKINHYLSYIFPWYFHGDLPFDRHDWIVLRGEPNNNTDTSVGTNTTEPKYIQVRYVLDFYGGPDDANGMPTFSVDVRPALDNFTNVKDRFNHFTSAILSKLSKDER
ncbi:holocytochrome c synthase CYC3 PWA37_002214 [Arxiozyma heterogenica]|uniref:holocytochrome c synthase CYC3 n=1 Tax=Arxiozyma heterogenica TaxID=278026 RepID=UPI002F04D51D